MSKNMGIRGKHRAPDWSRGMRPFPEYDGNPIAWVDGGCDIIVGGICATIRRAGASVFDLLFTREDSAEKVGVVFNFEARENERIWRRPCGELARRNGLNWRNVCGYVHALHLGVFKLA